MESLKDDYKLENILLGAKSVAYESRNVRINYDKVREVSQRYSKEDLQLPAWDAPVFPEKLNDETIDFILLGNSINFAFNDFKTGEKYIHEYKGVPFKGAYGMWAALKGALDEGLPILDADYLENLSGPETKKIFDGANRIPMLNERVGILNEVGRVLNNKYEGHFYNLVERADERLFNDGKGLVELLVEDFPSFRDDAIYHGKRISFAKRAQLGSAMVYEKFLPGGSRLFDEKDVERLTVFADYELPKALRSMGIFEYDAPLADRIDNEKLIGAGSNEEVELRACTIAVADEIVKEINDIKGSNAVNALHIDYRLWLDGRNYKDAKAHMAITTAY